MQNSIKSNPKLLWSFAKSRRRNNTTYPNVMHFKGEELLGGKEICTGFSSYFHSMFANPAQGYANVTLTTAQYSRTLSSIKFEQAEVLKCLKNVKIQTGPGPDGLPPIFIARCAKSFSFFYP